MTPTARRVAVHRVTRGPGARRAALILAVVLVATLAGASVALANRAGHRAFCSSGTVQYEYVPGGWFDLNSYADVHERICLTPRGAGAQLVDVRIRVTVQMAVSRNVPIFETDSTWAEVETTVDDRVTNRRCDFPELSRMTPYALHYGRIGNDRVLAKDCRFAVPAGSHVTVRLRFHGVEHSGGHTPLSGSLSVSRDGAGTRCLRGARAERCARVFL